MSEEYFLWTRESIFRGYLYSLYYDGNFTTYTFYTDFKNDRTAGEYQLCADIKVPTNAPISDDDISKAFAESLSKEVWSNLKHDSKRYVGCMKTLPTKFYTETNLRRVVKGVMQKTANTDEQTTQKATEACYDVIEYSDSLNAANKQTTKQPKGE